MSRLGCCPTCGAQIEPTLSTEDTVETLRRYCRENGLSILLGQRLKQVSLKRQD